VRPIVALFLCVAAASAVVVYELPEGEAEGRTYTARPQEVVSVALDGHDLPVASLRSLLQTRTGDLLEADKLAGDRANLEAALVARGYLDAKVTPAQVSFDAAGAAFVTFAIQPGAMFHVRDVQIVGAAERDTGVVTLSRGAVAAADRVEQARAALAARLVARGRSGTVAVKLAPDAVTSSVDVVLAVN